MSEAGERMLEGAREMVASAKGEQPAASITIKGHTYYPRQGWLPIEDAPQTGEHVILELHDSIPDVPLVAVGSFLTEVQGAELGEELSAAGGWLIWTGDADWYVIPFDDAFGWMPAPRHRARSASIAAKEIEDELRLPPRCCLCCSSYPGRRGDL